MTDSYEFRVSGLIGPVVESALPELTAGAVPRHTVLTGTADSPKALDELLRQLTDNSVEATHIVIGRNDRFTSHSGRYSAPRQS